jgi:hypothetical protein
MLEAASLSRALMLEAYDNLVEGKGDLDEFIRLNAQTIENMARVAPYLHPKLVPKRPEGELPVLDLETLSDRQLDVLLCRLDAKISQPPTLDLSANTAGAESYGGG